MAPPYDLPGDLQRRTLGVSWKTIGQPGGTQPSPEENQAALMDVCYTATSLANDELNQDVRSSLVTEELYAPSHWAAIMSNGMGRLLVAFNPVVDVPFMAVSAAAVPYPKTWTVLPPGSAWSERRPVGIYGVANPSGVSGGMNSILVAGNRLTGQMGRAGQQIAFCYSHGWPHAVLTEAADVDDVTLAVDEVCGFTGAAAIISDGANTETVQVSSVTLPTPSAYNPALMYFPGNFVTYGGTTYQATMITGPFAPSGSQQPGSGPYWATTLYPVGPGTLSLVAPLTKAHAVLPVLVTSMVGGVRWGMALYAKAVALERGLATLAAPGKEGKSVSTAEGIEDATVKAVAALRPFARIV
jgi:hypothetical protein